MDKFGVRRLETFMQCVAGDWVIGANLSAVAKSVSCKANGEQLLFMPRRLGCFPLGFTNVVPRVP